MLVKNKGNTSTHGSALATAAWREYSREASMQAFPFLVLSRLYLYPRRNLGIAWYGIGNVLFGAL